MGGSGQGRVRVPAPSEQKVAEFFLAHAEELEDLTIGELARAPGSASPR